MAVKCEVASLNEFDILELKIQAAQLEDKDAFSTDPYLSFYRQKADQTWRKVYQTDIVKASLNPMWEHQGISIQDLCDNDYDQTFLISCWDFDESKNHDFIGKCETSINQMLQRTVLDLKNPNKEKK